MCFPLFTTALILSLDTFLGTIRQTCVFSTISPSQYLSFQASSQLALFKSGHVRWILSTSLPSPSPQLTITRRRNHMQPCRRSLGDVARRKTGLVSIYTLVSPQALTPILRTAYLASSTYATSSQSMPIFQVLRSITISWMIRGVSTRFATRTLQEIARCRRKTRTTVYHHRGVARLSRCKMVAFVRRVVTNVYSSGVSIVNIWPS